MQFTAMNTLTYSDIEPEYMSAASTLSSTIQQLAVGIGVAFGAFALNSIAFSRSGGHVLTTIDFQLAFVAVGIVGVVSTLLFLRLPPGAGMHMMQPAART
jgi:hypothetical protein